MFRSDHVRGNGILLKSCQRAVLLALALAALLAFAPGVASASTSRASLGAVQRSALAQLESLTQHSPVDVTSAATKCTVPKLTKLTNKQANAKLKKAGCGAAKAKRIYSSKIKKGHIVKQSP